MQMKDNIKARLKDKFSGVNLSQKRIDAIADRLAAKVTDEAGIDEALDAMNEYYPFADMARDDDRLRTLEANQKKQEPTKPTDPPKPDDTPEWAKALLAKVENLEKSKQVETFHQKALAKLNEKQIPESFTRLALKNLNVNSDEELESFLGEIETNYTEFRQSTNDNRFENSDTPITSSAKPDKVKADIKAWAESQKNS
jgi:hypothetical protein